MIEIKMTGMCEGCPNADLELQSLEYVQFGGKPSKHWEIFCTHEQACKAMMEKTKGAAKTWNTDY